MSETCGHGQGAGCAHCAIAQHRLTRLGIRSDEVDYVVDLVVKSVNRLRELSPLWEMHQDGIDIASIQWTPH